MAVLLLVAGMARIKIDTVKEADKMRETHVIATLSLHYIALHAALGFRIVQEAAVAIEAKALKRKGPPMNL